MNHAGLRLLAALLVIANVLMVVACSNGLIDPKDPPATALITTTIGGVVVDESGSPMAGVTVSAHGSTSTTNATGLFIFKNISVPSERACVIARTRGYFNAAHAEWPKRNGVTMIQLTMQKATETTSFVASVGGTATISLSSVTFPANGFVTASGASYAGTVSVAAAYLTPDDPNVFEQLFAGDGEARRADNSSAQLVSYGVIRVLLTGASGELLQLKPGTTATLRYAVPKSLAPLQPSTIPLWYFDEAIGMWKEEGQAALTSGMYVGSVSHFTDWNLDVPSAVSAVIEGTVRCAANRPIPNVWVRIGQTGTVTDENGHYKRRIPARTALTVEVDSSRNNGMSSAPIDVPEVSELSSITVDVIVSPCPTMLEGTIVDCNGKPTGGFVQVKTSRGILTGSTSDGRFSLRVPSDEVLTVTSFSIEARTSSDVPVQGISFGSVFNMGSIQACGNSQPSFFDISLGSSYQEVGLAYLDNGATIAVLRQPMVEFYNASTGAFIRSIDVGSSGVAEANRSRIMFSADESVMMVGGVMTFHRTFQTSTGNPLATLNSLGRSDIGSGFLTADGKHVILMDSAGTVSRRSAVTGTIEKMYSVQSDNAYFLIGLQNGGSRIVLTRSYSDSAGFVVWDAETDKAVLSLTPMYSGYGEGVLSLDGTVVNTTRADVKGSTVDCFDLVRGVLINSISTTEDSVYSLNNTMAISPDNQQFVSSNGINAPFFIRRINDGSIVTLLSIQDVSNMYYIASAYDPSGTHLAVHMKKKTESIVRIYTL